MRIKKTVIMALVLTLLTSALPAYARLVVTTTEAPQGWSFVYNENATTANSAAGISSDESRTGKKSLNMGTTLTYTSAGSVEACYRLPDNAGAGNYTLTLYIKGDYAKTAIYAGVGANTSISETLFRFTETTDGEWKKYEKTIAYKGEEALKIKIVKGADNVYIDDVSMKSGDTELIENGGFENMSVNSVSSIVTEPATQNPSQSGIASSEAADMPKNFITYTGSELTLSWINPEKSIEKVRLYEVISGITSLITDELPTDSGEVVNYVLPKEKENRNFRLVFTYTDESVRQYVFGNNITPKTQIQGWNVAYNAGVDGKENELLPMSVSLDRTQKHGAAAAVKISSNAQKLKEGSVVISQPVSLSADKTYMLYMWEKVQGTAEYAVKCGETSLTPSFVREENGYKLNSYRITEPGADISITFTKRNEAVWLDDIELYAFENGNPTGENLITNGDFETGIAVGIASPVSNINAEALENAVKLSWTNPDAEYRATEVYRKEGQNWVKCAILNKGTQSVTIGNLQQDITYEFAVSTKNAELNDSAIGTVSAVPKGPAVVIDDVIITGQANGVYSIKRTINNNYAGNDYKAELIAALVENGIITKIESSGSVTVAEQDKKTLYLTLDAGGANPANSSIQIYTWDELFGKDILISCEAYSL